MAIYLTKESKVLVQGMTGAEGMKHTRRMLAAGTDVVGGVNPRKAGRSVDFDDRAVPVFGSVREGIESTGADVSVVFVPPAFAKAAVVEAADAGIGLAVVITEGIPVHDAVAFTAHARSRGTRVIGPNCPGLITPGQSNAGIIPPDITKSGRIGLVSKSGTLTYQLMYELRDIGFTTCVGIGGDPVVGTSHIDCLTAFENDPDTELIILIGEIGGDAEERAAAHIREHVTKPVVGYIAGFTAPEGRTMGHAGAIVSGSSGTARAKQEALEAVGVRVGSTPTETARHVLEALADTAPDAAAADGTAADGAAREGARA
ncbi:succinate--CoA ligase subunit alpha [Streptomyces violaceorubidus]|uniref:Succinate--CoA ligase [ADP-forming] subunit alpha n=1 Tax=Streptomyces violaceorubidus TaxID=284042 RepID=A0ABV1STT1_9ACTN